MWPFSQLWRVFVQNFGHWNHGIKPKPQAWIRIDWIPIHNTGENIDMG